MNYQLYSKSLKAYEGDCLVASIKNKASTVQASKSFYKETNRRIASIVKLGDMEGKSKQTLLINYPEKLKTHRLLLLGIGKEVKISEKQYIDLIEAIINAVKKTSSERLLINLNDFEVKNRSLEWLIKIAIETIENKFYIPPVIKKENKKQAEKLQHIDFYVGPKKATANLKTAIKQAHALGQGKQCTKDLGNLPGNICTPTYLAETALSMAEKYAALNTQILEEAEMQALNMGSLLSVSQGSCEPAKFIIMHYTHHLAKNKPHVFIGKGITFDAGGISIKPSAAMDEMKYDMCGAASVFGLMTALCEMELELNVIGIVPASENLPDGKATKPGDIVTSMSGLTIEVLNTDAEGRLVLCDALTYSERFKPESVIDIATLTGACIIALGNQAAAVITNNNEILKDLEEAANTSLDRIWQLPNWPEYNEQLKSNFADLANIGGRAAGTITAGCFLSYFAKKLKWAHLDIAGVAWTSGKNKGATGRPLSLLVQYCIGQLPLS